jgi:hypothetical protein
MELLAMELRNVIVPQVLLIALVSICGCKLGEGNISDHIPKGHRIPLDQVPAIVLPDAKRQKLPAGTTIEHCDGDMYRFNYPDGTIWFKNSKGDDCGGVI